MCSDVSSNLLVLAFWRHAHPGVRQKCLRDKRVHRTVPLFTVPPTPHDAPLALLREEEGYVIVHAKISLHMALPPLIVFERAALLIPLMRLTRTDTPPGTASNSLPPVPDVPLYVPGEQGPASEASSPSSPDGAEGLAYTPATSPPHAPGPTLLERLADLAVSDPNYPTSSGDSDELVCDDYGADDGGWANGVYNDEEGCGLGSDVENGCVAAGDGVPSADGRSGDASPGAATLNNAKRLDQLHVGLGGRVLEGGASNCTFNTKAKGSQYFPYENFSVLLLFQLVHKFQLSETVLSSFLTTLTTVHNGERFNVDDIRGIDAKHFYARRRSQHPLLDIVETMVPITRDDQHWCLCTTFRLI